MEKMTLSSILKKQIEEGGFPRDHIGKGSHRNKYMQVDTAEHGGSKVFLKEQRDQSPRKAEYGQT